jgi:hypothetical protein
MMPNPFDDPPREDPTAFDWDSPRWRENEADPGEVERHRRSRIDDRPRQRGVVDQGGSVSTSSGSDDSEANLPPSDEGSDGKDSSRRDQQRPQQKDGGRSPGR